MAGGELNSAYCSYSHVINYSRAWSSALLLVFHDSP